jgi:hypothetical protein
VQTAYLGELARSARSANRLPEVRFPDPAATNASQNVDEAHHYVRADECADALDQENQSEQTEKNQIPNPDRGLYPPPDDEQKRDQPDSNAQCSKPIHAGSGIKTTHVQLPLFVPPKGGARQIG